MYAEEAFRGGNEVCKESRDSCGGCFGRFVYGGLFIIDDG